MFYTSPFESYYFSFCAGWMKCLKFLAGMLFRICMYLMLVGLVASRKLLYIQVITKDLRSNKILECILMDPKEDESLAKILQEAARKEEGQKKSRNFFQKMFGLNKKELKQPFSCLGKTITVTEPQYFCKVTEKLRDLKIRPIMCQQDVTSVFVIRREPMADHKVYGFCIDPDKFYVFHFLPDNVECTPETKGVGKGIHLQWALIVQPYIPKGCVSSYLRYLEEKDWKITQEMEREDRVEKMSRCYFKTLQNVIDHKNQFRSKAMQMMAPESSEMQEARKRSLLLEAATNADPFFTKEDLDSLHESVTTTVLNFLTPEHRLKNFKHRLTLEPRLIDKVDSVYIAALELARKEAVSKFTPPLRSLLKIDAPTKLTQRQIFKIFIISQTKYRRLLIAMLVLMRNIHDTCEYVGNKLISRYNALSKTETLNGHCATACQFVSEFAKTLVFVKSGNIIEPVCLGASSGLCQEETCKCTILSDRVGPNTQTVVPLTTCTKDIFMVIKTAQYHVKQRQAKLEERRRRKKQVLNGAPPAGR